ncbi:MAG: tetratricopeptide repeat protein [Proteobacteria bacterium]|nr:tetratricopeptide repeat protein [Pseudomonadota bacterium]MCL2307783.1 tetratricopeptide repeat protein [Pseudomonadota bacterium]
MAVYDHQEQEQLEDIKAWWNEWGGYVTAIAAAACVVLFSVQGWRWWKVQQADSASTLYFAVSDAVLKKDSIRAREAMTQLADGYGSSSYAPRAALLMAETLWASGDKAGAQAQLQWVIDRASESDLKDIARYRLAETLIEEQKFDDALRTLDAKHSPAFEGLFADTRGDALFGAGRHDEARAAYQTALLKVDNPYRNVVQIKLDGLGGPVKPVAPEEQTP